jgi:GntR family transcriptional regulator
MLSSIPPASFRSCGRCCRRREPLDLNHNTVARAYKLLEGERVIVTAGRKGTFVDPDALEHISAGNSQDAGLQMKQLVTQLATRGVPPADIEAAFAQAMAALARKGVRA